MDIMGTFLLLATEALSAGSELAEEAGEGGFGLNIDIFETNLINLAVVIGILFYFGRKFLGNILTERRAKIETAIKEAEIKQKDAAASLADAQQKLAQAQAEAQRIRAAAEESAKAAREAILEKAAEDARRIIDDTNGGVEVELEKAIAELRKRAADMALEQVESYLKTQLDESAQQQLIDRSIAQVGGDS